MWHLNKSFKLICMRFLILFFKKQGHFTIQLNLLFDALLHALRGIFSLANIQALSFNTIMYPQLL